MRIRQEFYFISSAARLLGCLGGLVHSLGAFSRRKAQLLDQKSQVDTEPLGGLNTAPGSRIPQSLFRSRQLSGRQCVQFPHDHHGSALTRRAHQEHRHFRHSEPAHLLVTDRPGE